MDLLNITSKTALENITNNSTLITFELENNAYKYCKYHEQPYNTKSRLFHTMAILIPGLFGLTANVFVIVLAAKFTVRKNLHHLIINMAVSDATVIAIHSTFELWFYSSDSVRIFLSNIIPILEFIFLTAISASTVTLFIISLERFKATWFISRRRGHYSLKRCLRVITGTWLISIGISIFRVIFGFEESATEIYLSCVYLASILFLFSSILILSSLTLHALSRIQEFRNQVYHHARPARWKRIRDTVRMVQFNLLLYFVCFLPYVCLSIINTLNSLELIEDIEYYICIDWVMVSFIITSVFPIINCSLSPCVYFLCLPQFREAAKKVLCRGRQSADHENNINCV